MCIRDSSVTVRSDAGETVIPADHPGLEAGWHAVETDDTKLWRWTDGSASLPWAKMPAAAVVTIDCTPVDAYPVYDERGRLVA